MKSISPLPWMSFLQKYTRQMQTGFWYGCKDGEFIINSVTLFSINYSTLLKSINEIRLNHMPYVDTIQQNRKDGKTI